MLRHRVKYDHFTTWEISSAILSACKMESYCHAIFCMYNPQIYLDKFTLKKDVKSLIVTDATGHHDFHADFGSHHWLDY